MYLRKLDISLVFYLTFKIHHRCQISKQVQTGRGHKGAFWVLEISISDLGGHYMNVYVYKNPSIEVYT